MADSRDDRNVRLGDGARHRFFVERPQLLQRAAAPADNEHVGFADGVQIPDRLHDGRRGGLPLDKHRIQDNLHLRKPPVKRNQNIPDRRSRRRRYNADAFGVTGKRPLPPLIEQPLLLQLLLQLLVSQIQAADAVGLHMGSVELVLSVPLIHRYISSGNYP
ncbi:hypothetical protein D3C71_1521180 [compost metagenome]